MKDNQGLQQNMCRDAVYWLEVKPYNITQPQEELPLADGSSRLLLGSSCFAKTTISALNSDRSSFKSVTNTFKSSTSSTTRSSVHVKRWSLSRKNKHNYKSDKLLQQNYRKNH